MKLNCDMGESFGSWTKGMDAEVMPYIDMANIACGFHASDPLTMDRTVRTAIAEKVAIGAHPGYPDLLGFGRRDMEFAPEELQALLVYQIAALDGICRTHGTAIEYIKPHGALYNKMAVDRTTLAAVMAAVRNFAPHCPLVAMATPDADEVLALAADVGIDVWFEAFSDRAYSDEGRLVKRSVKNAVHDTPEDTDHHRRQRHVDFRQTYPDQGRHSLHSWRQPACCRGGQAHAAGR